MAEKQYDFSGWATRNDLRCSDGRTIRKNAFAHCDGMTVPLVYNHRHNDVEEVLGHCVLENRDEGVYTYGYFNSTKNGQNAKEMVQHGDIVALSIYANQLKQNGSDVLHGAIREVSLVLAGANPGAYIDNVILAHSMDDVDMSEGIIYTGEPIEEIFMEHSAKKEDEEEIAQQDESKQSEKDKENKMPTPNPKGEKPEEKKLEDRKKSEDEETLEDVFNTLSDKQKTVVYALIGQALEDAGVHADGKKEEKDMKHNVFDQDNVATNALSHADEEAIINLAKSNSVGSLQEAIGIYAQENGSLSHSIDDIDQLFPEYTNITPGAPDMITTDQGWIAKVINGVSKSPISRIKTRIVDAKDIDSAIRGLGYKKGDKKTEMPNVKLLKRSMDPQTVYVKDKLDRDDIVDITDFDVVEYEYKLMRLALNEEIATAIMIGDGREEGDDNKIQESHIKPIWTDDELYTIHQLVDIAAAKKELQGTNTSANFGENYVYAEAIIAAALHSREKYKGSGKLDFYCTPHLLNVMLLARDLNGRRIYSSKSDLAAALNVNDIITAEQFEGKTRTTSAGSKRKLLGLFVNLNDYKVGNTKGGEITKFEDFDIDFNQYKYLMETRISGGLTKVFSAIALEEEVTTETASDSTVG